MKEILIMVLFGGFAGSSYAQAPKPRPRKPAPSAYTLLQGIWAASEKENAEFWVSGNRLTYVEFQDQPLRYAITPATLTIFQPDGPDTYRIKKLTRDSLVVVNYVGRVMRLYKRKAQ